jgi:hypothetical protein
MKKERKETNKGHGAKANLKVVSVQLSLGISILLVSLSGSSKLHTPPQPRMRPTPTNSAWPLSRRKLVAGQPEAASAFLFAMGRKGSYVVSIYGGDTDALEEDEA